MWVAQFNKAQTPRTLLTSGGLGTMGFGMGAAIGAQTAHPDKRVVLVTGDGSFHMNLNELVTMKSYDLPVVILVMNNSSRYGSSVAEVVLRQPFLTDRPAPCNRLCRTCQCLWY